MSFNSTNNLYGFPQPLSRVFPAPIISQRAPLTSDYKYQVGQQWIDELGEDAYILVNVAGNSATWNVTAITPGNVDTLTGGSGGAISPSAGNINLLGTTNQITTIGSGSTITWSLSSTLVAPGSLEVTSGFTVDAGAVTIATGTSAINISADAAATTVNFATGAGVKTLVLGSTNSTSVSTLACGTGGCNVGTSANAHTTTVGSTTTTSTLNLQGGSGGVNCNTDFALSTVATKILMNGGAATDFIGTATLSSGTVVVANTNIAAADRILLSRAGLNSSTAVGLLSYTISASTSFTITAVKPADATTETGDTSIVSYVIFRQT